MKRWKYRGVAMLGLMLLGSFFVISTISGLLDRTMRKKTPAVTETYVPPSGPTSSRPVSANARSLIRGDRI